MVSDCQTTLVNVTITNSTAGSWGGALMVFGSERFTAIDCEFTEVGGFRV